VVVVILIRQRYGKIIVQIWVDFEYGGMNSYGSDVAVAEFYWRASTITSHSEDMTGSHKTNDGLFDVPQSTFAVDANLAPSRY
jgi:hypothetical protein